MMYIKDNYNISVGIKNYGKDYDLELYKKNEHIKQNVGGRYMIQKIRETDKMKANENENTSNNETFAEKKTGFEIYIRFQGEKRLKNQMLMYLYISI